MQARVTTDVEEAARGLRAGELVAIPTETVYGLAANALDADACLRVFEAKGRPSFDPLIVHVAGPGRLEQVVEEPPEPALRLIERFWPGPLTLVLPRGPRVPDVVTSGLPTVAVRQPAHPLTARLLESLPFPLAAPSANPFGRVSPTTAAHVLEQLGDRIALVLDGGPCSVGVESTIVGFEEDRCLLYRPGGLAVEELEAFLGRPLEHPAPAANPAAPGSLASHYAPRCPLVLGNLAELLQRHGAERVALLSFRGPLAGLPGRVLSPSGDLAEAARGLFAALRELDAAGVKLILAEPVPDHGLGRAINDRLRRAAARGAAED